MAASDNATEYDSYNSHAALDHTVNIECLHSCDSTIVFGNVGAVLRKANVSASAVDVILRPTPES